jgi:hypothetical protein
VIWQLALEYVKAVFVWPVAAVVIVALLRKEIRELAARIVTVRFPGGEFQARQQGEPPPASGAQVNAPPPPPLPPGLTDQQRTAIIQVVQSNAMAARLWEYRYLNCFLVMPTQYVLNWFVSINRHTTLAEYDAVWAPLIPNGNQRRIILDVLGHHHLVYQDGPGLVATDKAKEYVRWRGELPPPAAAAPPPPSPPPTPVVPSAAQGA